MQTSFRRAVLLAVIAVTAVPASASASTYTVYGQPDGTTLPDGHGCDATLAGFECATIRAAVIAADAAGGSNSIQLGYGTSTLSIAPSGADDQATGDLNVVGDLTITGAGASASVIDAQGIDRVFSVPDGASLRLKNLALVDGATGPASRPDAAGGAIEARGSAALSLDHVRVLSSGTPSGANGGAIASATGALAISHSWIEGNTSGGDGGGVLAAGPSSLSIDASTLDGNRAAGNGGGLDLGTSAAVPIVNSTIFNNSGGGGGGGIYALLGPSGQLAITNATIVQNTAAAVAGNVDQLGGGSVSLQNSIVGAGKVGSASVNCALAGASTDLGNNLFFDLPYSVTATDDCLPAPHPGTDILTASGRLANGPGLDPSPGGGFQISSNGGPAGTVALVSGSPALNAANSAVCRAPFPGAGGVDERDSPRFPGSVTSCDIGAEEPEALLGLSGTVTPTTASVGDQLTFVFSVTNNGPSTATSTTLSGTLPPGGFGGLSASQGYCSLLGNASCALGSIPVTTSGEIADIVTAAGPGTYSMTIAASDAESGATAPVTVTALVTGTAPAPAAQPGPTPEQALAAAKAAKAKQATANCSSQRRFRIHIQNVARLHVVSARIFVRGRLRATVRAPRFAATINLKKRPLSRFVVTIVARQQNGHTIVGKRAYHPCRQTKLGGHTHLLL